MENVHIEKPGNGMFIVRFGPNRAAAEKELQEFIGGRKYMRFINHFNPNHQIIEIVGEVSDGVTSGQKAD